MSALLDEIFPIIGFSPNEIIFFPFGALMCHLLRCSAAPNEGQPGYRLPVQVGDIRVPHDYLFLLF
jgi:hypothetical protein